MASCSMVFKLSGISEMELLREQATSCTPEELLQKDPSYIPSYIFGFNSNLKQSDKEYIFNNIYILHIIYRVVNVIYK